MRRRSFLGALICCCASTDFAYAGGVPFCSYSITRGWNRQKDRILARRATDNDKSGVPQVVARIKETFRFENEIDILIARDREDNAFATVAEGRRLLVADVGFLRRLNRRAGTDWAAIQVIAHEVGHHIAGFLEDDHLSELNADYWSGQALARLGASERAASNAFMADGTERDTTTHPNKYRRLEAISAGWRDGTAGRIDYSRCLRCAG